MEIEKEVADAVDELITMALLSNAACVAFDTETTGLRGVVIQLGWIALDSERGVLASSERLLRPPIGYRVEERAVAVHGLTQDFIQEYGEDPASVLRDFLGIVTRCAALKVPLVAHNASFDVGRLAHTASVVGIGEWDFKDAFCTMRGARSWFSDRVGRKKAPKNDELYVQLRGHEPDATLHQALSDATVTAENFVVGTQLEIWSKGAKAARY